MHQTVTIVTDVAKEHLATGLRRRLEHLVAHATESGATVVHRHLFDSPAAGIRGALARDREIRPEHLAPAGSAVVIVGLLDVGLMMVADRLSRAGFDVVFDQCDSMLLQVLEAVRAGAVRDAIWGGLRWWTRRRISRDVVLSYISERDRRWDRVLNLGRSVTVVPPNIDPALLLLERTGTTIERVSVPADFASPHLARGLKMLWAAMGSAPLPVQCDFFGPAAPPIRLPEGARYHGFADDIAAVYRGDTAVFIANIGGAGVPNKLLEAASAGRPVIAHPSVLRRVDLALRGWTYRSSTDIREVLQGIASGASPGPL